jgi:hypothetical protein
LSLAQIDLCWWTFSLLLLTSSGPVVAKPADRPIVNVLEVVYSTREGDLEFSTYEALAPGSKGTVVDATGARGQLEVIEARLSRGYGPLDRPTQFSVRARWATAPVVIEPSSALSAVIFPADAVDPQRTRLLNTGKPIPKLPRSRKGLWLAFDLEGDGQADALTFTDDVGSRMVGVRLLSTTSCEELWLRTSSAWKKVRRKCSTTSTLVGP